MKSPIKQSLVILILATVMSGSLLAHQGKNKRQPPAEALAACVDLAEKDACSFTFHEREITGTCTVGRSDDLLCKPDRRNKDKKKLKAAALEACSGLALEDSCSITSAEGEERFGICQSGRNDDITCRIKRTPKPDAETVPTE